MFQWNHYCCWLCRKPPNQCERVLKGSNKIKSDVKKKLKFWVGWWYIPLGRGREGPETTTFGKKLKLFFASILFFGGINGKISNFWNDNLLFHYFWNTMVQLDPIRCVMSKQPFPHSLTYTPLRLGVPCRSHQAGSIGPLCNGFLTYFFFFYAIPLYDRPSSPLPDSVRRACLFFALNCFSCWLRRSAASAYLFAPVKTVSSLSAFSSS